MLWWGLFALWVIDLMLTLHARELGLPKANRHVLLSLPVTAYMATFFVGHLFLRSPQGMASMGILSVWLIGSGIIVWEVLNDEPLHPISAALFGAVMSIVVYVVGVP